MYNEVPIFISSWEHILLYVLLKVPPTFNIRTLSCPKVKLEAIHPLLLDSNIHTFIFNFTYFSQYLIVRSNELKKIENKKLIKIYER